MPPLCLKAITSIHAFKECFSAYSMLIPLRFLIIHISLYQFHHPRPCIKTLAYSKMTQDYVEWVHDSQWNEKQAILKLVAKVATKNRQNRHVAKFCQTS